LKRIAGDSGNQNNTSRGFGQNGSWARPTSSVRCAAACGCDAFSLSGFSFPKITNRHLDVAAASNSELKFYNSDKQEKEEQ
jgi:hypothetical protein